MASSSSSLSKSPLSFPSFSTPFKDLNHVSYLSIPPGSSLNSALYLSQLDRPHKCQANGYRFPIVRSQSSPDYIPDAEFYKVEAILRPWRINQVSSALLKMGIRGVTVSDVRGFGAQGGLSERHAGSEFTEDKLLAKVKMEIVVSKDQVEAVIAKITDEARTGEIGDGKIFVLPVVDVIRVRTGERGSKAERMMGGHADMRSGGSIS